MKVEKFQETAVIATSEQLASCQVNNFIFRIQIELLFTCIPFKGVRELFEQEPMPVPKKSRAELMKDIDADYYGYRDDDDGILIPLEQEAEKEGVLVI